MIGLRTSAIASALLLLAGGCSSEDSVPGTTSSTTTSSAPVTSGAPQPVAPAGRTPGVQPTGPGTPTAPANPVRQADGAGQGASGQNAAGGVQAPPPLHRPAKPAGASENPGDGQAGQRQLSDDHQRIMNDPKYARFRDMCRPYFEIRRELRPLELALARGTATEQQVREFQDLEAKADVQRRKLLDHIWADGRTREEAKAMSLIMSLPPQ